MHDLDLVLNNSQMSNVNMQTKCPNMTSYMMAIVMFALSVTIYEIFTIKMCTICDLDI